MTEQKKRTQYPYLKFAPVTHCDKKKSNMINV